MLRRKMFSICANLFCTKDYQCRLKMRHFAQRSINDAPQNRKVVGKITWPKEPFRESSIQNDSFRPPGRRSGRPLAISEQNSGSLKRAKSISWRAMVGSRLKKWAEALETRQRVCREEDMDGVLDKPVDPDSMSSGLFPTVSRALGAAA
jgi:hypothetical protein